MPKFYHIAPKDFLQEMLRNGIVPRQQDKNQIFESPATLLLPDIDSAGSKISTISKYSYAELDLVVLEIELDEHLTDEGYETSVTNVIDAGRILRIFDSSLNEMPMPPVTDNDGLVSIDEAIAYSEALGGHMFDDARGIHVDIHDDYTTIPYENGRVRLEDFHEADRTRKLRRHDYAQMMAGWSV